jgi:hypothetical protein
MPSAPTEEEEEEDDDDDGNDDERLRIPSRIIYIVQS